MDDITKLYLKRARLGILLASGIKGAEYRRVLNEYLTVQGNIKVLRKGK